MIHRRFSALAAVFLTIGGLSCRDIPAPDGGVQALSRIVLASPGLVIGDTLRDSLGVATPLRIIAFDQDGDTVASPPPVTFFLLDTTATLDGDIIVGRHAGRARVVAVVAGLQSRVDTITVTLRPDTIVPADSTHHTHAFVPRIGDTTVTSGNLNVIVRHDDGTDVTGVDAVVVTYRVVAPPALKAGVTGPTVVFDNGALGTTKDTTAGGGRAARALRLRLTAVNQLPDSATVAASASYRGQSLGTVQFTIVFQTQ